MFDLLNPFYFYIGGAIGVLVPLVLHLIQTRRTVNLPFSTLRFLKLAQKQSASRIRMEHILLWLLRTALLVTLALAFAMPLLRNEALGKWFGRAPRDVAIVIDGSFSMDYSVGRGTVWERAVETATAIVEGLSEQDRLCLFVARDRVEPVIEQLSSDRKEALSRLKALATTQTSSQLAPAIMDANAALLEAKERREREIHILTDGQSLPWDSAATAAAAEAAPGPAPAAAKGPAREPKKDPKDAARAPQAAAAEAPNAGAAPASAWDPEKIPKETVVFVSVLGADSPENVAPLDVGLEPPVLTVGIGAKASVRFTGTGPSRSTTASLYVDEQEIASRAVSIAAGEQPEEVAFMVPPLPRGRHAARIQVPEDNLTLDNAFHFVLNVGDRLPVLIAGPAQDTFFLRAALQAAPGGVATVAAEWTEAGALADKPLDTFACIFLCNSVPLGGREMTALESYVKEGGLLAIFPGDAGLAPDYQAWSCLPGLPTELQPVPLARRKRSLTWTAPRHPILEPIKIGPSTVAVSVRKQLAWKELAPRAERLIAQGGEEPFLIGLPSGNGYVLFFAVSADRTWSDFPLSPFYLPILHQIIEFGAGVGRSGHYVWCAANLPLADCLPEATRDTEILAPDGSHVTIRSATVDTRTVLEAEDVFKAGVYRVRPPGGAEPTPGFAANMTRAESNLTPIDPAALPDRLGLKRVNIARDREELLAKIKESRVGRTFGEPLLWLALVLAALEFLFANFLAREPKEPDSAADAAGSAAPGKGAE